MAGKVNKSLQSVVHIRLREGQTTLYEGEGRYADLEVAGPVAEELV